MAIMDSTGAPMDRARSSRAVRDGLRAAGYYLDGCARQAQCLAQIADGIVIILASADPRTAGEALLLTNEDLSALAAQSAAERGAGPRIGPMSSSPDPLFPTGYEDFLRALSATAADREWRWPRLLRESEGAILHISDGDTRTGLTLAAPDVEAILNDAFRRRESTPPVRTGAPTQTRCPVQPPSEEHAAGLRAWPYEDSLAALDGQLSRLRATDTYLAELTGGFLLCFMDPDGTQQVEVVDATALDDLQARERRRRAGGGATPHAAWQEIGRYLDLRGAAAIAVEELDGEYALDYTTWRDVASDLPYLTRVHEQVGRGALDLSQSGRSIGAQAGGRRLSWLRSALKH